MPETARYRALPADLSSVPAVEPFLDRLGLGSFDPADLVSHTGRNDNWSGTTTTGSPVFVKHLGGHADDARRRLDGIIAFEKLLETAPGTVLRGPRCLGWSKESALVAFEMLPLSRTAAEHADAGTFEEKHAHRIGEMIGVLHGLDPAQRLPLDTSPPELPPVAALTALPLESHRTASGAELKAWSILQQDPDLAGAIRQLREAERRAPVQPVHCDLRLDQLLFAHDTIYLLDCEELRRGDPARDVGAYIGEWLYRAVGKLPGHGPATDQDPDGAVPSDRETITRGARELERLRPFVEQFTAGYRAAGRPLGQDLRTRSVRFAGWHLIDRVMARASQSSVLNPVELAAMGIARTVLLFPGAVTGTLGLED